MTEIEMLCIDELEKEREFNKTWVILRKMGSKILH